MIQKGSTKRSSRIGTKVSNYFCSWSGPVRNFHFLHSWFGPKFLLARICISNFFGLFQDFLNFSGPGLMSRSVDHGSAKSEFRHRYFKLSPTMNRQHHDVINITVAEWYFVFLLQFFFLDKYCWTMLSTLALFFVTTNR